jgi:hypothetical protein
MANTRSVDFLPEIFQTDANKQFLAATLDQLIQEPNFRKTQGFIGRTVGPGINPNDKYVVEPTATRANYQLEPGVVSLVPDTNTIKNAITYPGLNDAVSFQGGAGSRPDRLYSSEYYTWDPFVDFDTFINFSQYYWIPAGPDAVDVASAGIATIDNFVVTTKNNAYNFSGVNSSNPVIELIRGGSYTFQVTDKFWIQAAPGISGTLPAAPNISSRDVYGVANNGAASSTVVFNAPLKDAQSFYYNLASIGTIDLLTTLKFDQINNQSVLGFNATYGGIDGITNLNGRTLVFTNPISDAEDGGYDTTTFSQTTNIPPSDRYQVWTITYINSGGIDYIKLTKTSNIANLNKFTIIYGTTYSNTQWYKDATGTFQQIPLLTAVQDTLYYQSGTNAEIFGRIVLIEPGASNTLDVNSIIGKKTYTSPNGVTFTNGLKVRFTGDVVPANYKSGTSSFQCTATEAGTNYITYYDAVHLYVGQAVVFLAPTLGGLEAGTTYYVRSIAANGIKFTVSAVPGGPAVALQNGTGTLNAIAISNHEYYVSGVGTAIELLPVDNFVTPENYVTDYNDSTIAVEPAELDYLTISRASKDLNAWTRSNRWFHVDVLNATAKYNNTTLVLDNNFRAKRPIIQFRPSIRLWNMGTQGKAPVDIIDFSQTDAFSNVEGTTAYTADGYALVEGSRVIFAADLDLSVRDKIYVVSFATPDTIPPLIAQPIIVLTEAADGNVQLDECVVCTHGNTYAGKTFWFDGSAWIQAQQKTATQQAPLFNVYDVDGESFGNRVKYQSSNFVGSKLFSYAVGDTTILDPVLQFPLQYLNINNVGDIVFDNNLYVDTFTYTIDNISTVTPISSGAVREYYSRVGYHKLIGWQTAVSEQQIYQQFKFTYTRQPLKLDVAVKLQTSIPVPVIKIYVGSRFIEPSMYTYTVSTDGTIITLADTYLPTDVIEVLALSDQISTVGFYQVPNNLQSNPLNANSPSFTLGTIRTHYESICENLLTLAGPINGSNNSRDLGNIVPYGLEILQQSSPLTLAGYFMRSPSYNIFASLQFNSREYIKFKAQMLDAVLTQNNIAFKTTAVILDQVIQDITLGKLNTQPFYWSDMIPQGVTSYSNTYTVKVTTTSTFDTVQVYNYTSANYLGLCVYLNNVILTRNQDYVVAVDGPRLTIDVPLAVGDTVTINEYSATYGSFIPNTPSKMGLYPTWQPEIATLVTSNGTGKFIIGHDGSKTPVFGDIRDQVLLEFETRIYNNIKQDGNPVPLTIENVLPGQFRDTGYSFEEINTIFGADLLSYCGWNKLDYKSQTFSAANEFTWNYSNTVNRLDNQNLLGAWRGIYRYFYDTQQPSYTPWEMLGITVEPTWWKDRYGPAPYTADNLVLWDDLAAGFVADPVAPYYRPKYARPGLTSVIPTGTEGELLSPQNSVVGGMPFNQNLTSRYQKSWTIGDGGPVEASWWNSSGYAFSVMHVLAVTHPAKFFALFADRDLYKFDTDYNQYLYNGRYRLDANGVEIYGNGRSKASYINWIVDYNRQTGVNSTDLLTADLKALDVRLCYRMASYSDKQYIKLITEKSSPNSTNTTLTIPDESYNILLYKNQPFDQIKYSSVAVQRVNGGGYAVFGYGTSQPYFEILQSQSVGKLQEYSSGGITVRVPTFYSNNVIQVPYGFVFANETAVSDFLLSYGKLLETQGLTFTDRANGYTLDWPRMVNEFLYWSQQGWGVNALINLNPLAGGLTVTRPGAVVDGIVTETSENLLLDQNSTEIPTRALNIVRLGNTFNIQPLTSQSISYIDLRFTNFEHMIVLNNRSVFGDLIYDPVTGARQNRLSLVAVTTSDWNGSVDTPGFILNQNNVQEWTGLKTYPKGEIVKYKNVYWQALTIVQPSTNFDFNVWAQSNYNQIALGLLPNLANKADQLANSYNINTANIETDNDLLAYGLIGFKPRQYLAALNLDDVSQVNIYRQFLGTKGTIPAAELFKSANLGKEAADYSIYENWAVQRAVYGANANRSYFELRLNRAVLDSNPSLIQVVVPQQQSEADQTVFLSDVWRSSYNLTSTKILPTTTELPTDTSLPTAGYVSLNDTDITVFDITNTSSLAANIDKIKVGTSIWVAKINDYDWGIYRAQAVPGQIQHVCDNLNGTSRVIFNDHHGLAVGNKLIIKFFDTEINGVYQVLSVPSLDTVNIAFAFTSNRSVANGTGIGFTLQTMRVAQASDVDTLPYALNILPGAKVWVDDNGHGLWEVLQKNTVFSSIIALNPKLLDADEQYGASVTQARNKIAALVGSPRYGAGSGTAKGAVYVYVKSYNDQYTPVSPLGTGDAILTLDVTGVRGYGNAVDFGDQTWAVAGASASLGSGSQPDNGYACVIYRDPALGVPGSIPYGQSQLLTQPAGYGTLLTGAGEFGYSVAMSLDERWMYIGAPGLNSVHAYGYVDWQEQFIRTPADGTTKSFAINSAIQINNKYQLKVTLNGQVQTVDVDYTISSDFSAVTLTNTPGKVTAGSFVPGQTYTILSLGTTNFTAVGASSNTVGVVFIATGAGSGSGTALAPTLIEFVRYNSFQIPYNATTYNLNSAVNADGRRVGLFTATNIYSFSIKVNEVLLRPNIDYTFSGTTITFATSYVASDIIVVSAKGYFKYMGTIGSSMVTGGLTAGDRFGHSVSCTTDGRQVLIGTPNRTINGKVQAGATYVFGRNVQRFINGANASTASFTVLGGAPVAPVSVTVNNKFYINQTDSVINGNNSFTVSGAVVTIFGDLKIGDTVEIETNQIQQIQEVDQHLAADSSNFGQSVSICANNCSLYVGEPQSSQQIFKGGVVERFVNQSRVYGTITATVANPSLTAGHTIRINNQDVPVPTAATLASLAAAINATVPNVLATASTAGYLTISVKNSVAAAPFNKIQVAPGTVGTTFADLGFQTFAWTQTITSPYPVEYAGFGSAISINDSAVNLVIGAPQGTIYLETVFDDGTTVFDAGSTVFFSVIVQSGAIYTFDYLPSSTLTVTNPGKFVFGQQINNSQIGPYDTFGAAVNYTSGVLMIGAPKNDTGDSNANFGAVFVFENPADLPAWSVAQVQQPTVDIKLLNSVFLYDSITSARTEFLDFINPLQGKILGAARANLDYIGAVDPAAYNTGPANIQGTTWFLDHVGEIWWDTSTVRFIDPNQDSIVYASRRWAQLFPGSEVDVYQWVQSTTPPASYAGEGMPFNTTSYTVNSRLSQDGTFATYYYFWVRGITVTATQLGKTLPASTVASYIADAKASGIPYMAPINASTIALYNSADYISANDTVISIEYDREYNNDNVHVEYELIPQDRADGFLSDSLYRKLQDSFCGIDTFGNKVPDTKLGPAERYGVQFRPRQSMFVDRFAALKNYLKRANTVLAQYPISESRSFNLLNSSEPIPSQTSIVNNATVTNWNLQVENLEVLGFQTPFWSNPSGTIPSGYKYLVTTDSSQRGLWTIYTVQASDTVPGTRVLKLTRVQGYNTPDYWSYINWYLPGYNPSTKVVAEVPTYSSLATLTLPVGSSVKVTANAQGKFEIYLKTDLGWQRVVLQDGTIEFSNQLWDYAAGRFGFDVEVFDAQYFDQEPVTETRKIIQAINEELLIGDLAIQRNKALVLMFNFVLSEFSAPEWLVKTSLIDVDHRIRQLIPYQNYVIDNQEFVSDYIQEVKPYHVSIREFNLKYSGFDEFFGSLTDFDLPAYYNTSLNVPKFTSPILLPYDHSTALNSGTNTPSDLPATSPVWSTQPYNQWYNNHLLTLDSVEIIDGGSAYTEPPVVIIEGDAVTPAMATAVISSSGRVVAVTVSSPGSGYSQTPSITFDGGNGTAARAYAKMTNNLVRSFRTVIKYDRFQYFSDVLTWAANVTYQQDALVRYNNMVWQAKHTVSSLTFNLEDWTLISARALTGADRTMGYYVPGADQPGLELPLLIDGIDYPGVQVYGDYFLNNPLSVDAAYSSKFTDFTLGTLPTDINVDGGKFIGLYEGHAPEELINGAEFDTLDFRVYTRPGADWNRDGHGFQWTSVRYTYDPAIKTVYSWAGATNHPVQVLVSNITQGIELALNVNYTIDWVNQTVSLIQVPPAVNLGDQFQINVFELGGGSQLYRANYIGRDIGETVVIPVGSTEITSIAVFVNGASVNAVTWTPYVDSVAWNILNSYNKLDIVNNAGKYYRALQDVPVGTSIANILYWFEFVPTTESLVDFGTDYGATDGIALVAFGTNTIDAGYFVIGKSYTITTVGTTNWTSIGAASNALGVTFTATGIGSGTGRASTAYSWSAPQVQYQVANSTVVSTKIISLTNSMQGTNSVNAVVTRNGLRLQPPEGIEWIGDGSSMSFGLPQRGGYSQSTIDPATDIQVWIDNILQVQNVTYGVTAWTGSNTPGRQVVFNTPPISGARILITVSTIADYKITGNQLQILAPVIVDDLFAIITWNDTAQLWPLTLVFKGPVPISVGITEGYSDTNYDPLYIGGSSTGTYPADKLIVGNTYTILTAGTTVWTSVGAADNNPGTVFVATGIGSGTGTASGTVTVRSSTTNNFNFTPGSFDYSSTNTTYTNNFYLERSLNSAGRLWVSLNGNRLFEGADYTVSGDYLILASGTIKVSDVLVVEAFTNSIVPEAMAFRVFQDMRGVQATYRITEDTTAILTQDLSSTAEVAYVIDAATLGDPDLAAGVFGAVTINGERIMYRNRDTVANTISGLIRGTAGTGAANHIAGSYVYDIGRGNLLPAQFQDYVVSDSSMGDASTTTFYAPSIKFADFADSTVETQAIEVYVGGVRQYPISNIAAHSMYPWFVTDFDPLAVEFDIAPAAGSQVTILVRQGVTWYAPGNGTASNGIALQDTDTQAARFLRGL